MRLLAAGESAGVDAEHLAEAVAAFVAFGLFGVVFGFLVRGENGGDGFVAGLAFRDGVGGADAFEGHAGVVVAVGLDEDIEDLVFLGFVEAEVAAEVFDLGVGGLGDLLGFFGEPFGFVGIGLIAGEVGGGPVVDGFLGVIAASVAAHGHEFLDVHVFAHGALHFVLIFLIEGFEVGFEGGGLVWGEACEFGDALDLIVDEACDHFLALGFEGGREGLDERGGVLEDLFEIRGLAVGWFFLWGGGGGDVLFGFEVSEFLFEPGDAVGLRVFRCGDGFGGRGGWSRGLVFEDGERAVSDG